jgi:hypothetical protein
MPVIRAKQPTKNRRALGRRPGGSLEVASPSYRTGTQAVLDQGSARISLFTHFESQSDEIGSSPDAQLSFYNGARVRDGLVGDTQ